jgi:hypothetical protein
MKPMCAWLEICEGWRTRNRASWKNKQLRQFIWRSRTDVLKVMQPARRLCHARCRTRLFLGPGRINISATCFVGENRLQRTHTLCTQHIFACLHVEHNTVFYTCKLFRIDFIFLNAILHARFHHLICTRPFLIIHHWKQRALEISKANSTVFVQ